MTHQALPLLTKTTIASSSQEAARSRSTLAATPLKIAAGSGMILCSALLLNAGAEAPRSQTDAQPCDPVSSAPNKKNNCVNTKPQRVSAAPEPGTNRQWSDRFTEQLPEGEHYGKLPKEVETNYAEVINQAQSAASRDRYTAAIETISGIPKNSQHYELAQQLEEDWSQELFRQASNHFQQAEVAKSIALINKIPDTSHWHTRAVELKQRWTEQGKLMNQALAAQSAKDWQRTIQTLKALEGSPLYNSLPVQDLLQRAMVNLYEPDPSLLEIAVEDVPGMPMLTPTEEKPSQSSQSSQLLLTRRP